MLKLLGLFLVLVAVCALLARFLPAVDRPVVATAALSPYVMSGAPLAMLGFAVSRHWTLASVAAGLTVAVLAVSLPRYLGSRSAATGTTLRFVSANLYLGRADPHAVAALARADADVLAVQELTPELARTLTAALGQDFPHYALRPRDRAAGVGLWSRYPITASEADDSFSRGFLAARIQSPEHGTEVLAVSTHMPPPRSAFATWRSEITRLPAALRRLPADCPVIVGGDFNATQDVREFRMLLRDGYRDAGQQAGAGLLRTYPGEGPVPAFLAVDHILTRAATAGSVSAIPLPGSDHKALVATITLHPQQHLQQRQ
ncbi:endonuclease/exonuclease/phosphatase family protein [Mycobacterium sp. C31M]